jgi:hypothetical protein
MRALKPTGWGGAIAIKDVTFVNTVADVDLFTVTGDVICRVVAICKTATESAGACTASVGIAGATQAFIATTDVTTIEALDVWAAAAPATTYALMTVNSLVGTIVATGQKITLTRSAQIDSGRIVFYCIWTALSADGNVVAA